MSRLIDHVVGTMLHSDHSPILLAQFTSAGRNSKLERFRLLKNDATDERLESTGIWQTKFAPEGQHNKLYFQENLLKNQYKIIRLNLVSHRR